MKHWMRFMAVIVCAIAAAPLYVPAMARAQDKGNSRAQEDIKAFMQKVEEGDTLFNQKKYAEAAAALAAAHALYVRAERRDENAGRNNVALKPQTFPALRYFGYGMGENASLTEEPTGVITGTAAGLDNAANDMWMDASILSNATQVPLAGAFNDPPLVELSEDKLNSVVEERFGPVSRFKLPVPDDEWRKVVYLSRRAQLIVEYALQKYPEWKAGTHEWGKINDSFQHTGDQALADIKAKLAEAEPEYLKVVADFKKADPAGVSQALGFWMEGLDKALASVKSSGWFDWILARDLFISKDYLTGRRPQIVKIFAAEGKTMPADKLKPIEDKIAELKSAIEKNAPRWQFPTGKPHDAAIEARAKAAIKAKFPGATILKTALDSTDWTIVKNDIGIPRYRMRGVLVLAQIPGQKLPWLLLGSYEQGYAGGGTYNTGGTFALAESYSEVRIQSAR